MSSSKESQIENHDLKPNESEKSSSSNGDGLVAEGPVILGRPIDTESNTAISQYPSIYGNQIFNQNPYNHAQQQFANNNLNNQNFQFVGYYVPPQVSSSSGVDLNQSDQSATKIENDTANISVDTLTGSTPFSSLQQEYRQFRSESNQSNLNPDNQFNDSNEKLARAQILHKLQELDNRLQKISDKKIDLVEAVRAIEPAGPCIPSKPPQAYRGEGNGMIKHKMKTKIRWAANTWVKSVVTSTVMPQEEDGAGNAEQSGRGGSGRNSSKNKVDIKSQSNRLSNRQESKDQQDFRLSMMNFVDDDDETNQQEQLLPESTETQDSDHTVTTNITASATFSNLVQGNVNRQRPPLQRATQQSVTFPEMQHLHEEIEYSHQGSSRSTSKDNQSKGEPETLTSDGGATQIQNQISHTTASSAIQSRGAKFHLHPGSLHSLLTSGSSGSGSFDGGQDHGQSLHHSSKQNLHHSQPGPHGNIAITDKSHHDHDSHDDSHDHDHHGPSSFSRSTSSSERTEDLSIYEDPPAQTTRVINTIMHAQTVRGVLMILLIIDIGFSMIEMTLDLWIPGNHGGWIPETNQAAILSLGEFSKHRIIMAFTTNNPNQELKYPADFSREYSQQYPAEWPGRRPEEFPIQMRKVTLRQLYEQDINDFYHSDRASQMLTSQKYQGGKFDARGRTSTFGSLDNQEDIPPNRMHVSSGDELPLTGETYKHSVIRRLMWKYSHLCRMWTIAEDITLRRLRKKQVSLIARKKRLKRIQKKVLGIQEGVPDSISYEIGNQKYSVGKDIAQLTSPNINLNEEFFFVNDQQSKASSGNKFKNNNETSSEFQSVGSGSFTTDPKLKLVSLSSNSDYRAQDSYTSDIDSDVFVKDLNNLLDLEVMSSENLDENSIYDDTNLNIDTLNLESELITPESDSQGMTMYLHEDLDGIQQGSSSNQQISSSNQQLSLQTQTQDPRERARIRYQETPDIRFQDACSKQAYSKIEQSVRDDIARLEYEERKLTEQLAIKRFGIWKKQQQNQEKRKSQSKELKKEKQETESGNSKISMAKSDQPKTEILESNQDKNFNIKSDDNKPSESDVKDDIDKSETQSTKKSETVSEPTKKTESQPNTVDSSESESTHSMLEVDANGSVLKFYETESSSFFEETDQIDSGTDDLHDKKKSSEPAQAKTSNNKHEDSPVASSDSTKSHQSTHNNISNDNYPDQRDSSWFSWISDSFMCWCGSSTHPVTSDTLNFAAQENAKIIQRWNDRNKFDGKLRANRYQGWLLPDTRLFEDFGESNRFARVYYLKQSDVDQGYWKGVYEKPLDFTFFELSMFMATEQIVEMGALWITLLFFIEGLVHMAIGGVKSFFYAHHGHGPIKPLVVLDFLIVSISVTLMSIEIHSQWLKIVYRVWRLFKIFGAVHEHLQHIYDEEAEFKLILHDLKDVKKMLLKYSLQHGMNVNNMWQNENEAHGLNSDVFVDGDLQSYMQYGVMDSSISASGKHNQQDLSSSSQQEQQVNLQQIGSHGTGQNELQQGQQGVQLPGANTYAGDHQINEQLMNQQQQQGLQNRFVNNQNLEGGNGPSQTGTGIIHGPGQGDQQLLNNTQTKKTTSKQGSKEKSPSLRHTTASQGLQKTGSKTMMHQQEVQQGTQPTDRNLNDNVNIDNNFNQNQDKNLVHKESNAQNLVEQQPQIQQDAQQLQSDNSQDIPNRNPFITNQYTTGPQVTVTAPQNLQPGPQGMFYQQNQNQMLPQQLANQSYGLPFNNYNFGGPGPVGPGPSPYQPYYSSPYFGPIQPGYVGQLDPMQYQQQLQQNFGGYGSPGPFTNYNNNLGPQQQHQIQVQPSPPQVQQQPLQHQYNDQQLYDNRYLHINNQNQMNNFQLATASFGADIGQKKARFFDSQISDQSIPTFDNDIDSSMLNKSEMNDSAEVPSDSTNKLGEGPGPGGSTNSFESYNSPAENLKVIQGQKIQSPKSLNQQNSQSQLVKDLNGDDSDTEAKGSNDDNPNSSFKLGKNQKKKKIKKGNSKEFQNNMRD